MSPPSLLLARRQLLAWPLVLAAPRPAAAQEVVEIAAEDDWAPYSSRGPDGTVVGLTPDLVRAAFKTQGIEVRFRAAPFARCMDEARSNRAAGCFNATITDDNRLDHAWHTTPLFHEELAIFARSDRPVRADLTERDLPGSTVGLTIGYTYPTSVTRNPKIRIVQSQSDTNLLRMLAAGRVDYILANTMPIYHRLRAMRDIAGRVRKVGVISSDGFWIAFSPGPPGGLALASQFEQGLAEIRRNGEYERIITRFRKSLGL